MRFFCQSFVRIFHRILLQHIVDLFDDFFRINTKRLEHTLKTPCSIYDAMMTTTTDTHHISIGCAAERFGCYYYCVCMCIIHIICWLCVCVFISFCLSSVLLLIITSCSLVRASAAWIKRRHPRNPHHSLVRLMHPHRVHACSNASHTHTHIIISEYMRSSESNRQNITVVANKTLVRQYSKRTLRVLRNL